MKARRLVLLLLLLGASPWALALDWAGLWLTPDQQAQRLMREGRHAEAAQKFTTPGRIGAALFMAGDFTAAAAVLGRLDTAEAHYNRGNAHVMLGEYETAINAYRSALNKRPGWPEAEQNLAIAVLRQRVLAPPDDAPGTGGMLGADEYVFDLDERGGNTADDEVMDATDQAASDTELRALWLRRTETRPADFLAARFNYQLATRERAFDEGAEDE